MELHRKSETHPIVINVIIRYLLLVNGFYSAILVCRYLQNQ